MRNDEVLGEIERLLENPNVSLTKNPNITPMIEQGRACGNPVFNPYQRAGLLKKNPSLTLAIEEGRGLY